LHVVKKKSPNAYGLYDMLGNAAEWVSDWYDAKYYASSPESDPQGPQLGDEIQAIMDGHFKGARGGGFFRRETRVSTRLAILPTMSLGNLGFRCVGN
jgi:formylglycine-generating enzyme required for sulfatase activity